MLPVRIRVSTNRQRLIDTSDGSELWTHLCDWEYVAEGNAHCVFRYASSSICRLEGKVLKLPKRRPIDRLSKLQTHGPLSVADLDILPLKAVARKALCVVLDTEIALLLQNRPHKNQQADLLHKNSDRLFTHTADDPQTGDILCTLETDLVDPPILPMHIHETTFTYISVEIKPKGGIPTFISPEFVTPWLNGCIACTSHSSSMFYRFPCRYVIQQYKKLNYGKIQSLSKFDPEGFFTCDKSSMYTQLENLIRTPQNNVNIFINGDRCKWDIHTDMTRIYAVLDLLIQILLLEKSVFYILRVLQSFSENQALTAARLYEKVNSKLDCPSKGLSSINKYKTVGIR